MRGRQQQSLPAPSMALPLRKANASRYCAEVLSEDDAQAHCSSTHSCRSCRAGRATTLPLLETSRPYDMPPPCWSMCQEDLTEPAISTGPHWAVSER